MKKNPDNSYRYNLTFISGTINFFIEEQVFTIGAYVPALRRQALIADLPKGAAQLICYLAINHNIENKFRHLEPIKVVHVDIEIIQKLLGIKSWEYPIKIINKTIRGLGFPTLLKIHHRVDTVSLHKVYSESYHNFPRPECPYGGIGLWLKDGNLDKTIYYRSAKNGVRQG